MKISKIIRNSIFIILIFTNTGAAIPTFREIHQYINSQRNYEALQKLQEIVPDKKEIPLYYFLKGKALSGVKRYREAIDYLNRAYLMAKHRSLKEDALFERGKAYFKQGFYYEAVSNFKNFLQRYPESDLKEEATILYAQASIKIKDFVRALILFREVPEDRPESIFGKAEVLQKLGLYKSANALYNKGFISYREYLKKNPHILYFYAENLLMIGNYEKARTLLYSLMETSLKYKAYIGLGLIEFNEKNYSKALNYFQKALYVPDRVSRRKAMLYTAKSLIKLDKKNQAKQYLHGLIEKFPYTDETEEAVLLLSRIYREEEEFLKASRFLNERLFGKSPDKKTLDELKSLMLQSSHKNRKAFLRIWDKSGLWLFSPAYEDILLEIAESFMENNDGDFLRIYNFLLKEGSRKVKSEVMSNMIVFYADIKAKERVQSLIGMLKRIGGKNDSVYRAIAWSNYLKGNIKDAYNELLKIKNVRKKDLDLLVKVKDGASSVLSFERLYRRFCSATSTQPDYEMLGDLYFERGDKTRAVKLYRLALKVKQNSKRLLFKVGLFGKEMELLKKTISVDEIYSSVSSVTLKEMKVIDELRRL
jgi:tetratricopeptide (TPR) repeat protein